MAKAIVLIAALACFLLTAEAFRTTVVINEEEDENRHGQQGSCREKFEQTGQLESCQRFIKQEAQKGRRGRNYDTTEDTMEDEDEENSWKSPQLKQCCDEIRYLSLCRCDGLKMAVQHQLQRGQMAGDQTRKAYEVASNIPNMCKMPPGRCHFTARTYF